MIYPPDQEDENARIDAEQDAKLERAMADREDDKPEEVYASHCIEVGDISF